MCHGDAVSRAATGRGRYGADFAGKLLSGEARPLPEYYDEVRASQLSIYTYGRGCRRERIHLMSQLLMYGSEKLYKCLLLCR